MKATQVKADPIVTWKQKECVVCGFKTYLPYAYRDTQFCFCTRKCYDKFFQPLMKE
jgi:hypothetical protein